MTSTVAKEAPAFLAGGGEMGALIRAYDWAATPLGPPAGWPVGLKIMTRLLLSSKHAMFLWWGEALIQLYNDAYRTTLPPQLHPHALGRSGPEFWGEGWARVAGDIEHVMGGAGAVWREDESVMVDRDGRWEESWWTFSLSPIEDDSRPSGVGGVLAIATDVTAQHRAAEAGAEALRVSEERLRLAQAAGGVGAYEFFPATGEIYASDVARQLWGVAPEAPISPEAMVEMIHPQDRPKIMAADREDLEARAGAAEYRIIRADTGETRWLSRHAEVLRDPSTGQVRVIGAFQDITDQKRAAEHRELLIHELNHRVKNVLATVQSVARQTLAGAPNAPAARERLEARLLAMARAHDTLTRENWGAAALAEIVADALRPFGAGEGGAFEIAGPPARAAPKVALALAMALHELATNAVKYGALSRPEGRVSVTWRLEDARARLTWRETGGPPVSPPRRRGFGSRLLNRGVALEFGEAPTIAYEPEGLVFEARAPVTTG